MLSEKKNMSLVKRLVSNVDILKEDYHKVSRYARKVPNTNQKSFGKGWEGIMLKYGNRYSTVTKKIPDTLDLISDNRVRVAHFIILHPKSFVMPNDHIVYHDNSIVHHIPFIVPEGENGMIFEDTQEVRKWKIGEAISYESDRLYAGYNFTDQERVLLHIVEL